jgi:hypothetical protein
MRLVQPVHVHVLRATCTWHKVHAEAVSRGPSVVHRDAGLDVQSVRDQNRTEVVTSAGDMQEHETRERTVSAVAAVLFFTDAEHAGEPLVTLNNSRGWLVSVACLSGIACPQAPSAALGCPVEGRCFAEAVSRAQSRAAAPTHRGSAVSWYHADSSRVGLEFGWACSSSAMQMQIVQCKCGGRARGRRRRRSNDSR